MSKKISVVGIDLGKNLFHLYGTNANGKVILRKKLSRAKLAEFMLRLEPCLVGLEACGGAHHWARLFRSYGHDVRLMSPQYVKPYVKSNKNDELDAEAICEAVTRPTMRFVPIKSHKQQDLQSLHRARQLVVAQRTAQSNQIRGLLLEYGIVIPKSLSQLRRRLPEILEDAENALSDDLRALLAALREQLLYLDDRVNSFDQQLERCSHQDDACRRLQTIPGIGPITATALVAAAGDPSVFKNGRHFAAWLGLVPRQRTTGGKAVLLGISKRGDRYLRSLMIHGARARLQTAPRHEDSSSRWLVRLQQRRCKNIAAVAAANKNARIAWSLLARGETYQVA